MRSAATPSILFVTSHWPHGPHYGAQQRALNICRLLTRTGRLSIIVASPDEPDADSRRRTEDEFDVRGVLRLEPCAITGRERLRCELDPRFMNTHYRVATPEARHLMLRAIGGHDIVWVYGLHEANAFGIYRWPHTILDMDDVQSRMYAAKARADSNLIAKLLNYRMAMIWRRRERRLRERFDVVTVCSEDDRRYLDDGSPVRVVPNGFAALAHDRRPVPAVPPRLGFIGLCEYGPNRDGLEWFIRRVWPLVKQSVPDARFRVAGRGSDAGFPALGPDIDALGYVDDATDEIATWTAMVVPIRFGGGTRVKIAEAFSRRCPVVSTSLGAVGYGAGDCLMIGDDPPTMAAACVRVLRDRTLAGRLADNAWREFNDKWNWSAIERAVSDAVTLCAARCRLAEPTPGTIS